MGGATRGARDSTQTHDKTTPEGRRCVLSDGMCSNVALFKRATLLAIKSNYTFSIIHTICLLGIPRSSLKESRLPYSIPIPVSRSLSHQDRAGRSSLTHLLLASSHSFICPTQNKCPRDHALIMRPTRIEQGMGSQSHLRTWDSGATKTKSLQAK